jgi:hypothetical protein
MINLRAATVCNILQPTETSQPVLTRGSILLVNVYDSCPSSLRTVASPIKVTRNYMLARGLKGK